MQIFCDFDGTISSADTTDWILDQFAAPAWRAIEEEWRAGRISARDCMQQQIALISASDAELDAALDGMTIDPPGRSARESRFPLSATA